MTCAETIAAYAFRSIGYGERLLPRSDFTLCQQVTLIGSGMIWNIYFGLTALVLGFFFATALALVAVKSAREAGVPVCLDGNYRANLWDAWDGDPRAILTQLVSEATILIGNHRDISLLLGKTFSGDGPDRRREASEAAFEAFENLQVIASTARHVDTSTAQRLAARVDLRDSHWQTDEVRIDPVVDRIGTGDAFAAGVLFRWLEGGSAQEMAKTGLALAAMKHGIVGDSISVPLGELDSFNPAGADVSR